MLRIIGLTHSFVNIKSDPIQVLSDISFHVEPGEFVSLVGPNGCGKSTLLKIIAGLCTPTQGHVLLKGNKITGPGLGVGMVFQDIGLFAWKTVHKNIEFGLLSKRGFNKDEKRKLVRQYIFNFGLSGFAHHFPHQLSGGMRQKVAIARTLINEPEVLLMDEPFGAVDSVTRNQLQKFLVSVWQETGKTIILVTHNIDEAVYTSERIIFFSRRPAKVETDIRIDIPYPRNRTGTKEQEMRAHVLALMTKHTPELGWVV